MAFERLLRLTKKCPGYVVSGLRNAGVGFIPARVLISTRVRHRVCRVSMATVTQESFESQYYITRALFGTRSLFAMTAPLKSTVRAQNTIKLNCAMNDSFFLFIFFLSQTFFFALGARSLLYA